MIDLVKYIGGGLIALVFPVFIAGIWGDTTFWGKVFFTLLVGILFALLLISALESLEDDKKQNQPTKEQAE